MEDIKLVIVIQCEVAKKRCSSIHCMQSFFNREHSFENYPSDKNMKFLTFNCGGCNGKSVNTFLNHVTKNLNRDKGIEKDNVVIHLASCIAFDNHHSDKCMFIDYIKSQIIKAEYKNIVEGSYLSKMASKKREEGIYKKY